MDQQERIKASDLLVRALENEGVEYIFGVPGEENLDFIDSLRLSPIRLVLTPNDVVFDSIDQDLRIHQQAAFTRQSDSIARVFRHRRR